MSTHGDGRARRTGGSNFVPNRAASARQEDPVADLVGVRQRMDIHPAGHLRTVDPRLESGVDPAHEGPRVRPAVLAHDIDSPTSVQLKTVEHQLVRITNTGVACDELSK